MLVKTTPLINPFPTPERKWRLTILEVEHQSYFLLFGMMRSCTNIFDISKFGDKVLEVTYMKEKYNTPDCHCEFDTEVGYFNVVPVPIYRYGVISLLLEYMDFVVCSVLCISNSRELES